MRAYPEVAAALERWFARTLGVDRVEVRDLERHAEGFSWHTYTLTLWWHDPRSGEPVTRGLAVRREPEDGLLAPYDTRKEFELHRAVIEHSDVPMPALHWLELDPEPLGMPFYVMDRVEGVVPVPWRRDDPRVFPDEDSRRRLGRHFVGVMGDIHTLDWKAAGLGELLGDPGAPNEAAVGQIDAWEAFYEDALLIEEPIIRQAIGWLRANVATSDTLALVHADYRLGNFMVRDGRIVAVFDWELAYIGDPLFDIAYAALPLYRGRDPRISQLLVPEDFYPLYEAATGIPVDADVLRFWTVFGQVRAAAPHLRASRAFEDGRSDDIRLAAMGHQVLYILKSLARELGLA